jgi:two-component system, response regulator YesN
MEDDAQLPPGVDQHRISRLAKEFRKATRLPLRLVHPDGRGIWSTGPCGFCSGFSARARRESLCQAHVRTSVEESFRWGEPFFSLCPFGLVTFAVPVFPSGRISAGLVSGFCALPEIAADIQEEALQRARSLGMRPRAGAGRRPRLRVLDSASLRAHAALLSDLTGRAGVNDPALISESRERNVQQFRIADYLTEARGGERDLVASLVRMQAEIIDKVVLGDLTGSREIVNRFLGVIFLESGMNFDMLKVRLLELIVIISRAAMEKGISASGLLGPRYSYLTDINAAAGFDDLFWKVTKVLENFNRAVSEEMARKSWAHVTKMKDYVKRNFTAKIAAARVAEAAGLSVSRALHLFRRECGMTLSAYIARQRIAYAKYLLENTESSIAEVASECGFFDQSHLTRTFASLEGVPPLRYRTRLRR